MGIIKFSHNYPKLHKQTSALLLSIRQIKIDDTTPKELLEYDTKYDGGYFNLPHGDYVQLIFLGNYGIPFTSIRKHYPPQKEDYYEGILGETFDVVIRKEKQEIPQLPKETGMLEKDFDDNAPKFLYDIVEQMQQSERIMCTMENEEPNKLKENGLEREFNEYSALTPSERGVWCYNHNSEYRAHAIRFWALKKLKATLDNARKKSMLNV